MLQAILAEVSGEIREGCFREGEGGPDGIERTEIQEAAVGSGVGTICGWGETLAKQSRTSSSNWGMTRGVSC